MSASLRYDSLRSGQTCVMLFSPRCRPTRCACFARFAQTNGGKSEHEATLSCGSVARSLNRVPQAQPDGWKRTARKTCDEVVLLRALRCDSGNQLDRKAISHSVLPLVTTPATAASWGWRLHRRVQTLRALTCGRLSERSATGTQ